MLVAGVTTAHVDPAMARTWLATAHQVVRETGGRVLGPVEPPSVGRNHYRVRVDIDGRRLRLLLNAAAGLVAVAEDVDPHALATVFRTVPRPDLFTAAGLHVAAPADLEQPLDQGQLTHLNADEQRDIAYHRPARVGDAVFNWFD